MQQVNIIGAGLAGLSAAITLAESGVFCNLISLQPSERAQSVLAEGGINAALDTMGEHDTTEEHFRDTMKGGADLADPNAVDRLTRNAPQIVRWLSSIGTPLQKENGHLVLRNFGGQKKKRTAYARSSTGKILMTSLIDEARKHEAAGLIRRLANHQFLRLILGQDSTGSSFAAGVRIRDLFTGKAEDLTGPVLLCSGGMNGIFDGMTTGTTQNTGDVTATVFAQGAVLGNLEFLQYHPTTIGIAGKRCLISEAARGEGGRLYILRGGRPWYFMEEKYPELGNLMPRDVVSREMVYVCAMPECDGQVWLDLTRLSRETWGKKLSDLREECIHYLDLDPAEKPLPVEPGIHYFMGGILTDELHRTSIPGLYAAGECACQYHGANRLGGNSMLGAIFGGKTAARTLMQDSFPQPVRLLPAQEGLSDDRIPTGYLSMHSQATGELEKALLKGLGILRDRKTLESALTRTEEILSWKNLRPFEHRHAMLGKAMLQSALLRQESRGAHTRTDFPERDPAFRKTTAAVRTGDGISISFRPLPERRP